MGKKILKGFGILVLLVILCVGGLLLYYQGASSPDGSTYKANAWFHESSSHRAIVFIHGILSNHVAAWHYQDSDSPNHIAFWPAIIKDDDDFQNPSIFLGEYYTSIASEGYDIRNAARDIVAKLENSGVFEKESIIFVGHSTGGIVAREIVTTFNDRFIGKNVGLVLVASPTKGSALANRLAGLIDLTDNAIAKQLLATGNVYLEDLDKRFRETVLHGGFANFAMNEFIENHFINHAFPFPLNYLPPRIVAKIVGTKTIVDPNSGGTYTNPIMIRDSDHFSIAKPTGPDHFSHFYLANFFKKKFIPLEDSRNSLVKAGELFLRGETDKANDLASFALINFRNSGAHPGVVRSLILRGEINIRTGRLESAKEFCNQANSIHAESVNKGELSADALFCLGRAFEMQGHFDSADNTYRQALFYGNAMSPLHGRVRIRQGIIQILTGRRTEAKESFEEAYKFCTKAEELECAGMALLGYAALAIIEGRHADAISRVEKAKAAFEKMGDEQGIGESHLALAKILVRQSKLVEAKWEANAALQTFRRIEYLHGAAFSRRTLAEIARLRGNIDVSRQLLDEALADFRAEKSAVGEADVMATLGALERLHGDPEEAEAALRNALNKFNDLNLDLGSAGIYIQLAKLAKVNGNDRAEEDNLRNAERIYELHKNDDGLGKVAIGYGEIEVRKGNLEIAEQNYMRALKVFRNDNLGTANARLGLGSLHLKKGDITKARDNFKQAGDLYEKGGYPAGTGQAILALGNSYAVEKKFQIAISYFTKARDLFIRSKSQRQQAQASYFIAFAMIESQIGQKVDNDFWEKIFSLLAEAYGIYQSLDDSVGQLNVIRILMNLWINNADSKTAS